MFSVLGHLTLRKSFFSNKASLSGRNVLNDDSCVQRGSWLKAKLEGTLQSVHGFSSRDIHVNIYLQDLGLALAK